jgi:hypothetical protein
MYRDTELGVVFHQGVLSRSPFAMRMTQVANFLFTLVYLLLGARFVAEYVRAPVVPLVAWLDRATDVVYVPLRQHLANGHDAAGHPLAWAILAALATAGLVHRAVVSLLRNVARPREDDAPYFG